MDSKRILITGASGLIGSRLTEMLIERGHQVRHLSRSKSNGPIETFVWNIRQGTIENGALENIDTIIHLAGAGIADKRWTKKRKKVLIESRIDSADLLFNELKKSSHKVITFISASAMGYYGMQDDDRVLTEESPAGNDFLAEVTKAWENAADKMTQLNLRVVKLRIGIVLSPQGGALETMVKPVKWYVGAPLGTGKQLMSWVHIDDLCNMFIKAAEETQMQGAYNAIAPEVVSNEHFTKLIANVLKKPMFLPHVPAFFLKAILGELAVVILKGGNLSCGKLLNTGFNFQFSALEPALRDLFLKKKIK